MGVEDGFGSCEPPSLPHRKSTWAFCCSMSNKSPTRRQCGIASSSFPLQSSLPPALARNREVYVVQDQRQESAKYDDENKANDGEPSSIEAEQSIGILNFNAHPKF
uniref:Uncharacterized protein n=1 Tax=Triticum aestivum TaxID=4565 RepID=A0A077S869_WHEAT|nr:unnamed protein product [Triticum aestivum]